MPFKPGKPSITDVAVSTETESPAIMQPRCAPLSRNKRVSFRVSTSAIATTLLSNKYCCKVFSLRQLLARIGKSLITKPLTKTPADSSSSLLVPTFPICGYVKVTICCA